MLGALSGKGRETKTPHPPFRLTRSAAVYGDLAPPKRGEVVWLQFRLAPRNGQAPHLAPLLRGEVAAAERFAPRIAAGEGISNSIIINHELFNTIHFSHFYGRPLGVVARRFTANC